MPAKSPTSSRFSWGGKIVLAASGWIAALLLGLLELHAKINSFADEAPEASTRIGEFLHLDRQLTGAWSSSQPEGEVIAKPIDARSEALPGAPVHLSMRVYRGKAEGIISSGGLRDHYLYSLVELEGEAIDRGIAGVAWDIVNGEKVALARFTLEPSTRGGESVLLFKSRGPYFPRQAVLWPTEGQPEWDFGTPLKRAMKRITGADIDEAETEGD